MFRHHTENSELLKYDLTSDGVLQSISIPFYSSFTVIQMRMTGAKEINPYEVTNSKETVFEVTNETLNHYSYTMMYLSRKRHSVCSHMILILIWKLCIRVLE